MSEESKTLENVLHPVIFFQQKSVRPVIFYLKKSVRPVIFFSRKSMRPVILFFKKSMRPVIFGDQKSVRPAAVLTGPVSDKFCSLPNCRGTKRLTRILSCFPTYVQMGDRHTT